MRDEGLTEEQVSWLVACFVCLLVGLILFANQWHFLHFSKKLERSETRETKSTRSQGNGVSPPQAISPRRRGLYAPQGHWAGRFW